MTLTGMTKTLLLGSLATLVLAGPQAVHADDTPTKPASGQATPDKTASGAATTPVQSNATTTPVPDATPTTPTPYVLAGDDTISITVVNQPTFSFSQLVIPPDGKLGVPLLTPFSVLGKTTGEVADLLTTKWKRYFVNPSVSVTLVQRRKENVMVYGAVQRPGSVDYKPPMRVLEALAQVGGTPLQGNQVLQQGAYLPLADLSHVVVTHRDGRKQTLDLSHPELRSGTNDDALLEQGDVVFVPEQHVQVTVVGEVGHPGTVDYRENLTVEDAITAVGGFKDTSDLAAAVLTHDGKETKLDLDALYRHGDLKLNVKMAPGDQLLIPEVRNRTYVFGDVARPGYYLYKPGDHILDALNGTGGPLPDANLTKITLLHIAKDKKSAVKDEVNLEKFLRKGDIKYNMALEAGDVLFVPQKKQNTTSSDIWGLLSGFNLVEGVSRVFTGRFGQ